MTGFLWSDDADAFFGNEPEKKPFDLNPKRTPTPPVKPQAASKAKAPSKPAKEPSKPGSTSETPLSVGQLNAWIKRSIDESVSTFWLAGEIGNLNQSASGHVYLTIKDSTSQISAVLWRSTFERLGIDLREGMAVLVQGRIDVYGPRGTYQVIISRVEQQGIGKLQAAFKRLHLKLAQEGLFDAERKKTLPRFPTRIGFVTSPSGAAIHDFIQVLRRRWPGANVLLIPAKVQGEGAAEEIVRGIQVAQRLRPLLDVLVVGRGGGSLEDLWCFNEEMVVRAVAACSLPTISAVGHEIDITLCDLAADIRALTPSEAAERVVPSRDEILDALAATQRRIDMLMMHQIHQGEQRLQSILSRPIFTSPERSLETPTMRLDDVHQALDEAMDAIIQTRNEQLERASSVLDAISPLKTLSRGYSVTMDSKTGSVITHSKQVKPGQKLTTKLANGEIQSEVL